jgi:hypothetical protein
MAKQAGIFLIQNDALVAMSPQEFKAEDDFQRLLSQYPDLLIGDQIDRDEPRRWILAKREQAISTGEQSAAIWSIDHVFIDQDGIPTLVEIKRKSDSRLRREVVGQMLDYASNCTTYWTAETLQTAFEQTCREAGRSPEETLGTHLNDEKTPDNFWLAVQRNLQSRTLRLIFVADYIPTELSRIVEFLNSQMNPTEVLAIELRQFVKDGIRTIVPTLHGHSEIGSMRRAGSVRRWDQASLFDKLKDNVGVAEFGLAQEIYDWMLDGGRRAIVFGTGKENGSVYPVFKPDGIIINPFYLSSDGKVSVQFGALANKPVFGDLESRRELMNRFNLIDGVAFTEDDLKRYPPIRLSLIAASPNSRTALFAALHWMEQQIKQRS